MNPWPENLKLGWALPLDWPFISSSTHMSLMSMQRPDFIYLDTARGGDIAEKRDRQVQEAMRIGCTHILFLDGDMVYPQRTLVDLFDLLNRGADLASIICYRGYPPYDPILWRADGDSEKKLFPFRDYKFGDVVEAGATGLACVLVKREVFEKLEPPWFRIQREEVNREGKVLIIQRGEDTYFTRRATKAGFRFLVNTSYDIGHLREFMVDREFWLTYSIVNKLGSWENVAKLMIKLQNKEWMEREFPSIKEGGGKEDE